MAITLTTFASGDVDYIAKLNSNSATVQAAINNLLTTISGAGPNSPLTLMTFLHHLFSGASTLIGVGSYVPTGSGNNLTLTPGAAYRPQSATVVGSGVSSTIGFVGLSAATYYVVVDAVGTPTLEEVSTDALYSVVWSGSAFGTITRLSPAMFDATEENNARQSLALGTSYASLDARLEAGELATIAAREVADEALELAEAGGGSGGGLPIRKVGISLDGGGAAITTGVKGAIQVDFAGTIIGWSLIADQAGSLTVEIDRTTSSSPPAAPGVPNTTTDKISASAPVQLSAAQSSSSGTAGVSTWTTAIARWNVIQFNVTAVTTITRATLYLSIQQT